MPLYVPKVRSARYQPPMTVAPGALASTRPTHVRRPGGVEPRSSSSHHDVARNLLRKDFTGRFTGTFMDRASRPPVTPQGRDWRFRAVVWRPGLPPAGTAGSDSGKATTPSRVMRRGPFHHHHQPARLPPTAPPVHSHHPAERRLVVPTRPWPTGAHVGVVRQGLHCYRLYGDSQLNLRRTASF